MPDGQINAFPIGYNFADDPDSKANKTTTVNGQPLSANVVLASSQFSEAITGEKMLANLTYTVISQW